MNLDIMILVGSVTVSTIVSSWVTARIKAKNTKSISNSDWKRRDKNIEQLRIDTDRHETILAKTEVVIDFVKKSFTRIEGEITRLRNGKPK